MTKKMLSFITHCLLLSGMLYAIVVIAVVPAAACTTSECNTLRSHGGALCASQYGPGCNIGLVISCNSSGFVIYCKTASGSNCGVVGGQCH
jgi:hypothetical protein